MRTTVADIRSLVDRVDRGEIRLPEIQRGYAWKPPKVAGLVDSLYRKYPSGSLLFWETDLPVTERAVAITGPTQKPLSKPQYLLDGQQRLTSLHRVFGGHASARIVFNVETQKFQNESAATQKDVRWLRVTDLLMETEGNDTYTLVQSLIDKVPDLSPQELSVRLDRVKKIADYTYYIEILDDLPYEEVTDIFIRVNSRGVHLRAVDLALATLSARWPGVVKKISEESDEWASKGYPVISVHLLTRALAALGTEVGAFRGFAAASPMQLEEGWARAKRGVAHLVPLLKNNAGLATSELIPSENALVPLIAFLGMRPDEPLETDQANGLLYWLFGAFILGRYNRSVDTNLAQDLSALKSDSPIQALLKNLGLFGAPLQITEDALTGRNVNSPYFLLSYLVAKHAKAKDWWHGVDIGTDSQGGFKLEYHHIHPRARLKNTYSKPEINDLANLAFISSKANRKISDRPPAEYFPELEQEQLAAHFVPLKDALREPANYPAFIRERRRLLAAAMNTLLDSYRPAALASGPAVPDPAAGERLAFSAYGGSWNDRAAQLVVEAKVGVDSWITAVRLEDVREFFRDLSGGSPAGMAIAEDYATADPGDESVELPFGPILATGTLADWADILAREERELQPADSVPNLSTRPWSGGRTPFPVVDSE